MACSSGGYNRDLAVLAAAMAELFSRGRSADEIARLGAFFVLLGDTLALFSLGDTDT